MSWCVLFTKKHISLIYLCFEEEHVTRLILKFSISKLEAFAKKIKLSMRRLLIANIFGGGGRDICQMFKENLFYFEGKFPKIQLEQLKNDQVHKVRDI